MKLSQYIEELQKVLKENGDLRCYYAMDDEGNGYQEVVFSPGMCYTDECGQHTISCMYTTGEMEEYDGDGKLEPICMVN